MASPFLKLALSPNPNPRKILLLHPIKFTNPKFRPFPKPSRSISAKSLKIESPESRNPTILLDVGGMMCGACAARVKSILSSDDRVESVVVNMVTETSALSLRTGVGEEERERVAEELKRRLVDCGFTAERRRSGRGVGENVEKWREMAEKKEVLLARSRNRVVFAWTLVALCCGSHASHLLHGVGIHVAHGMVLL